MANIRVTFNADKFVTRLRKAMADLMPRSVLERIGAYSKDRIVRTTQTGYNLASGDQKAKNRALSEGYIRYRKNYQSFGGVTGEFFSPRRSNLTFTGQLLRSISTRILSGRRAVEVFVPETKRTPPTLISTRKIKTPKQPTNAEVARDLADRGRPFMGMDAVGRATIKNIILRDLRAQLRASRLKTKP